MLKKNTYRLLLLWLIALGGIFSMPVPKSGFANGSDAASFSNADSKRSSSSFTEDLLAIISLSNSGTDEESKDSFEKDTDTDDLYVHVITPSLYKCSAENYLANNIDNFPSHSLPCILPPPEQAAV